VIYIVDDDDAVRDSLELLIMAEGVAVEGFSSGAGFLAAVDPTRRASVILDLHMPGSGGFDVVAALAAREIRMPVVLISGRVDAASRERAIAAGVHAVLEKPLDHQELLAALDLA
jgi:two-component system response regulator FixJ